MNWAGSSWVRPIGQERERTRAEERGMVNEDREGRN